MNKLTAAQQALLLVKQAKGNIDNSDLETAVAMYQLTDKQVDELLIWIIQNDLAIQTHDIELDAISVEDAYFQEIAQYPLLTRQQEKELTSKIKEGDKIAKDQFIKSNLRLVVSIAKQYQGQLSINDLIQEGNIGLLKAVNRFDGEKGVPFISYAQYWIRQAMSRAISQNHVIHLPINLADTLKKIRKIERKLEQKFEREPSNQEIAERLDLTEKEVKEIRSYSFDAVSIDKRIDDSHEVTLVDLLMSTSNTKQAVNQELLREELGVALKLLNERDAEIIKMRYGIDYPTGSTLQQIAEKYSITKERVRQIIDEGLNTLKTTSINLIDFLED